jgi:hypothetical protein
LPATITLAKNAEVVCEATSLLNRVEHLMQESERIAAAAQLEKDWPAATGALREARNCLELLGKLRGELHQADSLHLHQHIHMAAEATNEIELDRLIAVRVGEATCGFDPVEIARLKSIAQSGTTGPAQA